MKRGIIGGGQSNHIGQDTTPAPAYQHQNRISAFSWPNTPEFDLYGVGPNPGAGAWGPAQDPLYTTAHSNGGVGAGMTIADRLVDQLIGADPDIEIGLIPTAHAGTGIGTYGFVPTMSHWSPYTVMMARIAAAKDWADEITAFVWYGGETNAQGYYTTNFPTRYPFGAQYPWEFTEGLPVLIDNVRAAVGRPDLPVILTNLGPNPGYTGWAAMQTYIANMAGYPNVSVVETADLTTIDGLHLDTASQVTLGVRTTDAIIAAL